MTIKNKSSKVINILSSMSKTEFGINAVNADQSRLAQIEIPKQIKNDEIPTLNRFGYMKIELDEFSQDFIDYAASSDLKVLELGTAYGFVVQQALAKGANVIANDISEEHLSVLIKATPKGHLKNLFLFPGEFPKDINFPSNSLGAVLISRLAHFLEGEEIEVGLNKINAWLVDGGKLFFVAVSPYNCTFKDRFLSIYNKRVGKKEQWPGRIENQWEIAPEHEPYVPAFLHVFDIPQLEELLPKHGFTIEKIKLFDYKNMDSEGKGHIGFVATKN